MNDLALVFRRTRSESAWRRLWLAYAFRATCIVSKYCYESSREVQRDAWAESQVALFRATLRWDGLRKFTSYADATVAGALMHLHRDDFLRTLTIGRYMKGPSLISLAVLDDDEHPTYELEEALCSHLSR